MTAQPLANLYPLDIAEALQRAAALGDIEYIDQLTMSLHTRGLVRHPAEDGRFESRAMLASRGLAAAGARHA